MKINSKADLPKWFSLDKYKKISGMSDYDFGNQIIYRVFDFLDGFDKENGYFDKAIKTGGFNELIAEEEQWEEELFGPHQLIASTLAVEPLRLTDIHYMYNIMNREGGIPITPDERGIESKAFNTHFNVKDRSFRSEEIHCALNLSYSDDIILTSIKRMLPIWREQLGINIDVSTENPVKTSWKINRQKIISYNAFALYDLIRWQKIAGSKITKSVLAAALYPNGEYGETAITQTIEGYVEKIFSKNYAEFLLAKRHENGVEPIL